jgi:hypothetical protein
MAAVVYAPRSGTAVLRVREALPGCIGCHAGWQPTRSPLATIALNLLACGGIATLWFMNMLRTRLGRHGDRHLSIMLLGNGLPFLAMSFVVGAVRSAPLGTMLSTGAAPLRCRWRPGVTLDAREARFA